MKINDLLEARRNSDHPAQQLDRVSGPKNMSPEARGKSNKSLNLRLKPYEDDENIYISFTQLPKIGINPTSNFQSTPLGIYAYPLKEIVGTSKLRNREDYYDLNISNDVPYAGEAPFIAVIRATEEIMDVADYTKFDLDHDLDQFKELIGESNFKRIVASEPTVDFPFSIGKVNRDPNSSYPITKLWRLTYTYAVNPNLIENDPISSRKIPVRWNKILSSFGYDGFSDKLGLGFIHAAEKTQVFFLSKKSFEVVEMLKNPSSTYSNLGLYHAKQKIAPPESIYIHRENIRKKKTIQRLTKGSQEQMFKYFLKECDPSLNGSQLAYKIQEIIPNLPQKFLDIKFLDFIKENYKSHYVVQTALKLLRKQGLPMNDFETWIKNNINNIFLLPHNFYGEFSDDIIDYATTYDHLIHAIRHLKNKSSSETKMKIVKKYPLIIGDLMSIIDVNIQLIEKMVSDTDIVPKNMRVDFLREVFDIMYEDVDKKRLTYIMYKFAPQMLKKIYLDPNILSEILKENPKVYKAIVNEKHWSPEAKQYFDNHK